MVYEDYESSLSELLEKDKSFSIHTQAIHTLCIDIFKHLNNMSASKYMEDFIVFKSDNSFDLQIPSVFTELRGKSSLRYFAPVIWNMIPLEIRKAASLGEFCSKITSWKV